MRPSAASCACVISEKALSCPAIGGSSAAGVPGQRPHTCLAARIGPHLAGATAAATRWGELTIQSSDAQLADAVRTDMRAGRENAKETAGKRARRQRRRARTTYPSVRESTQRNRNEYIRWSIATASSSNAGAPSLSPLKQRRRNRRVADCRSATAPHASHAPSKPETVSEMQHALRGISRSPHRVLSRAAREVCRESPHARHRRGRSHARRRAQNAKLPHTHALLVQKPR